MIKIAPSILSADFANIERSVEQIQSSDFIHLDVMDGRFVPNITFGPKMVADIKRITSIKLDVHLMIVEPEKYIETFIKAGADYLSFHLEATQNVLKCLNLIKENGAKCAIAISPNTPVSSLTPYIKECDMILLMSVYPGFSGQSFIAKSIDRLRELKQLKDQLNPSLEIEIDGGINFENISEVIDSGAQIIVAGNTVFKSKNPNEAIKNLKNPIKNK